MPLHTTASQHSQSVHKPPSGSSLARTGLDWQLESTLTIPAGGLALAARADGSLFVVGGYDGNISLTGVVKVWPKHGQLAELSVPTHDAAAGFIGPDLYVFGGGQSSSYNTVWRITNGHTTLVDRLPQPLSDASCVPYTWDNAKGLVLVGGYNGVRPNRQVQ
ncbi:MAG: hypothetical protein K6T63_16145, partial [Alicyclobacillus herbarius]|uniref:hypothetical protein n=1 Tax=Alicyclobacillus herbarius TaxID=122960 RepID=UPI002354109F